ncbi:MAG: pyridoxamine 5'-phosphate oxidase family protein [Patulibacter sp.]
MTWHPGERAVQVRAGVTARADVAVGLLTPEIPAVAQEFLRDRPWLVIGAADADGRMWAGALHGPPGFLDPRDETTLHVHALPLAADPLAHVLAGEVAVGALAIDPPTRRRMRINARSRPIPGGLELATQQVYANCPKYISVRTPQRIGDGRPPADAPAERSSELSTEQRDLIERTDTFFVATRAPDYGADANHRGGNPGFVVVHDERHLTWPDYRGNSMFNTFGNLELDPAAGLLIVDFETGDLLQLTGRARVVWDAERIRTFPRAERLVDYEIDEVVQIRAAAPLRWRFESYAKTSPPPPPRG